jgi:nucleotide-binding universal stress UspA family protein
MNAHELADSSDGSWIKRIVVAVDGSPASVEGLKQVANIAPRLGADVIVVHVRHIPAAAQMAGGFADPAIEESLDDLESEVRREALAVLGATAVKWEIVVRDGSPGLEIVRVAEATGADLVVVGSNRHSSLHDMVMGSTSAYLATHSWAPVLVMRSRASGSVGDPDASMALVPPSLAALERWEMAELSTIGGARRRPEVRRVHPVGGMQR